MPINKEMGAGEMAQQSLVLTALLSSVPSTQVTWLTTTSNSSPKEPDVLFWPLPASALTCS